jgi:hypothetical protein
MQPTEPSLDVICTILTLSSWIINAPFAVKSEATEMELATKFGRGGNDSKGGPGNLNETCRNDIGCPGYHHSKSEVTAGLHRFASVCTALNRKIQSCAKNVTRLAYKTLYL